ncbi:hypothetical protein HUW63_27400 [Myxococcus sp. AM001]|nr:hypothetical protein [Myxococcus sp. AM001]
MKTQSPRHVLAIGGAAGLVAVAVVVWHWGGDATTAPPVRAAADATADASTSAVTSDGLVPPPYPVFPRGDSLTRPLDESSPEAQAFLDFYTKQLGVQLPRLGSKDLLKLPNRSLDIAHNGLELGSGQFNSSLVCQSCHDTDWKAQGLDLPEMAFWQQHGVDSLWEEGSPNAMKLAANWSLFGDWSGSIKALAGRDPVFLAQVETTRGLSPHAPASVDNLCFRCHSPPAQREANGNNLSFDHRFLYSTPEGSAYDNTQPGDPYTQAKYATYGALGRDGLSCSVCHAMAPTQGQPWNGTDYTLFYGDGDNSIYGSGVAGRLVNQSDKGTVTPPPYPFTSSMNLRPGAVVGPDTQLNTTPMAAAGLSLETAASVSGHTYLRDSTVCGACHVVILPKVPSNYRPGMLISEAKSGYERPVSCPPGQKTFDPKGDFLNDPCVALAYEQTTYFEWLNSDYPEGNTTCQSCHMPLTAPASPHDKRVFVAQYNDDLAPYFVGSPDAVSRDYNRHTLLGINLFVHEMFQQFPDVLGLDFYLAPDSRVPPFLQSPEIRNRTPNLVLNPGAEQQPLVGWSPSGAITAVQSLTGAQGQPVHPSHGQYFFQLGEGPATLDLTLSGDQARWVDQAGAKAHVVWGATAYCDRLSCGQLTLQALDAQGVTVATSAPLQAPAGTSSWLPLRATQPLATGVRKLRLTYSARKGEALMLDDLFLFVQLPDGITAPLTDAPRDYVFANNLLNAEQSILDLAYGTAQGTYNPELPAAQLLPGAYTTDATTLTVPVQVLNNAGHKFPSGAGFRRAFIQFEVLDAQGKVLWASGQPNAQGAICDGACAQDGSNILASEFTSDPSQLQPHYQRIQRQDQVQIYEVRAIDDAKQVTSLELQQFKEVKDNRILPVGWKPPSLRQDGDLRFGLSLQQLARLTEPLSTVLGPDDDSIESDPDYPNDTKARAAEGADNLVYQVPLSAIPNWASIRLRLNYQSIPPGYLGARFKNALQDDQGAQQEPGPAMKRLIYMSSHLNMKTNPGEKTYGPNQPTEVLSNWSLVLSETRVLKR